MLRSSLLITVALFTAATLAPAFVCAAAGDSDVPTVAELDKASQKLKSDILQVQAHFLALKRDIRYPAYSRWTVFVTRKTQDTRVFKLKRISLRVDGKPIAEEHYSKNERRALRHGGADRLHLGTLGRGHHRATVTLAGQYHGKSFHRTQTLAVNKPSGPRILVLQVRPQVTTTPGGASKPGVTARHLDDLP